MKKALYCLIIILIAFPIMSYGMSLEQELRLDNGIAVLQFVIPAFGFMLGNFFILLFDKENKPWIIIATSLTVMLVGDVITIGYYSLTLDALSGGLVTLILLAVTVCGLSLITLKLYTISGSHLSHHPKLKR